MGYILQIKGGHHNGVLHTSLKTLSMESQNVAARSVNKNAVIYEALYLELIQNAVHRVLTWFMKTEAIECIFINLYFLSARVLEWQF